MAFGIQASKYQCNLLWRPMQAQEVQHQVPQDAIRLKLTRGLCAAPALLALTLCVLAAIAIISRAIAPNLAADGAR